jgi:hypothetical protein
MLPEPSTTNQTVGVIGEVFATPCAHVIGCTGAGAPVALFAGLPAAPFGVVELPKVFVAGLLAELLAVGCCCCVPGGTARGASLLELQPIPAKSTIAWADRSARTK